MISQMVDKVPYNNSEEEQPLLKNRSWVLRVKKLMFS